MVSRRERRKQRARRTSETRISHTSDRKSIPSQRLWTHFPYCRVQCCQRETRRTLIRNISFFGREARRIRFLFADEWKITRTSPYTRNIRNEISKWIICSDMSKGSENPTFLSFSLALFISPFVGKIGKLNGKSRDSRDGRGWILHRFKGNDRP